MTVAAVSMVKDEADLIGAAVRHMIDQVDLVIVADNGSTDGTRDELSDLARAYPGWLEVVDEPRAAYLQAETMNRLAERAAGADWIVPFDADERWEAVSSCCVSSLLDGLPEAVQIVAAETYDVVPAPGAEPWGGPLLHRPGSLWELPGHGKVAYRPGSGRRLVQGSHAVEGLATPSPDGSLRVLHLPFRSLEQARRKLRNGKAAVEAAGEALPPSSAWHWREWGALDDEALAAWWADWTRPEGLEPVPWRGPREQEAMP